MIEMAACAGLPLVENQKNPEETTTYGVGELILDAAQRGCKKIIVGLGGSCTNDGGTGAAAAVGVQFFNSAGETFIPVGGTLSEIARIDVSKRNPALNDVEIVTMCDIDNPFYGENGAAFIFGPQKGADEEMVCRLDNGLRRLCGQIADDLGMNLEKTPGGGAAGAMGAGMIAFLAPDFRWGLRQYWIRLALIGCLTARMLFLPERENGFSKSARESGYRSFATRKRPGFRWL